MWVQSLFLESLSGQQAQAAEVALAQAAARDAVGERGELEHMLTWLTGAHAEEAAMHRTFKAEVLWAQVCNSVGCFWCSNACAAALLNAAAIAAAIAAVSLLGGNKRVKEAAAGMSALQCSA